MPNPSQLQLTKLTAASFAGLARQRLAQTPPNTDVAFRAPSDFDLNPSARKEAQGQIAARPAAVLVPVIKRPQPTVLFTLRPDHLTVHRGQISFPGGKVESGDDSPVATALREAREEIGLAPSDVNIVGYLDRYHTATGFLISPVVALVPQTFSPAPDPTEVDEVFEVPLAFLMNPDNHRVESKMYKQKIRKFYVMPYRNRYIWGATAGILRNLYMRLTD